MIEVYVGKNILFISYNYSHEQIFTKSAHFIDLKIEGAFLCLELVIIAITRK